MVNFGIYGTHPFPRLINASSLLISDLPREQRAPDFLLSALSKLTCYVALRDAEPCKRSI